MEGKGAATVKSQVRVTNLKAEVRPEEEKMAVDGKADCKTV